MAVSLFAVSCSNDDDGVELSIVPKAGELTGGPFTICIDGTPDMVRGIVLNNPNVIGANRTYVITDDLGNILGLPPTLDTDQGVNFRDASSGVCLIWYLRYENGLEGLEFGLNTNDLSGNCVFSNPVAVNRNQPKAGELTGGVFNFTIDEPQIW